MAAGNAQRLSKLAKEFNVGIQTIVDFLHKKGHDIDPNPNTKVSEDICHLLEKEYRSDINLKRESEQITLRQQRTKKESITLDDIPKKEEPDEDYNDGVIEVKDLRKSAAAAVQSQKTVEKIATPKATSEKIEKELEKEDKAEAFSPLKIVDKIDLDELGLRNKPKKEKEKETKPKAQPREKEQKPESEKPTLKTETEEKKEEIPPREEKPEEKPAEVVQKATVKAKEKVPQSISEEVTPVITEVEEEKHIQTDIPKVDEPKVIGKIDLEQLNTKTRPAKKSKEDRDKERKLRKQKEKEARRQTRPEAEKSAGSTVPQSAKTSRQPEKNEELIKTNIEKLTGPTIVGKIDLPPERDKKTPSVDNERSGKKKRRKRIKKDTEKVNIAAKPEDRKKTDDNKKPGKKKKLLKKEVNEEDVQKQIKDTLARLTSKGGKSKGSKYRREKRAINIERAAAEAEIKDQQRNVLKITEFVSVNELATMMNVPVTKIISALMSLGLIVSINQRLDAETMSLVADEFGYQVEFVSVEIQEAIEEETDRDEDLLPRPPIVTVMGHVDHGKTSLLDYIRDTNVIAGEAGGITQHIGAYNVELPDGRQITFLDTPGHEAFTAMRARGAQITDIAIIIVAADDNVMPQTIEAINHASAAGVPIVFAINKIDKAGANPEKIKEALAAMNYLVEEWGGKYQSQDISAKKGINVNELLEKVLLEAEILDLKANPNKRASGTIIESSLDKGRGYVATVLVQSGTLKGSDIVLSGQYYGHVKAMFNERNQKIDSAGPSEPCIILGLDGAPQAGDKFHVMEAEREARQIANKREQLAREQGLRTQKHITLDEIGRRIAIGNFQELNLIVKGDVDGSIEALSDSLIKLSTEEIQVNVIHKAVGQISESDIMLASASEAIVVGFQVRPSVNARKLAEKEQIDVRLYSIIYDAINEIKAAMQGMLSPDIKEEIVGTAEVLETFKITKVGTVAGCIVRDGKITRNNKVRVIRNGIVIYTGHLGSLKRFKEDVREIKNGYECGLNIENFNDIKVGDNIESFQEVEVAKQL
ncbi:MAG: translation initiation factor IF-2 [Prolixibacteraceae bacterium]|nr:translation initiation factor IF-2 [Prolixibacteraceae bacterium]